MNNLFFKETYFYATGRRKNARARVFLQCGNGYITINNYTLSQYFSQQSLQEVILEPIKLLKLSGCFDVKITVKGGGISGQAGAIRHAISLALIKYHEKNLLYIITKTDICNKTNKQSCRQIFRKAGYVTRDSRIVERKKTGLY